MKYRNRFYLDKMFHIHPKFNLENTWWALLCAILGTGDGEGNGTPLQYSCLEIPWTQEPGGLQSMGSLELDTTERLHFHFSLSCIGEGNGNPLQCSWLENPRERGAWWAAVYGVTQSWTQLKWLSSRAFPFSRGSSQPRDQTQVSRIEGGATREALFQ